MGNAVVVEVYSAVWPFWRPELLSYWQAIYCSVGFWWIGYRWQSRTGITVCLCVCSLFTGTYCPNKFGYFVWKRLLGTSGGCLCILLCALCERSCFHQWFHTAFYYHVNTCTSWVMVFFKHPNIQVLDICFGMENPHKTQTNPKWKRHNECVALLWKYQLQTQYWCESLFLLRPRMLRDLIALMSQGPGVRQ